MVLRHLAPVLQDGIAVIVAAKGIERVTGLFLHQVVAEILPASRPLILSGPGFAQDVIKGLPTALTLAATTLDEAGRWSQDLSGPSFRIYASDDIVGVEAGGALKNVLAIACGIADGRGLGDSARAALTTRGFAEMVRLGRALGARRETLTGLSGLGDLLLTCSSHQSRNYRFGLAIGEGAAPASACAAVEGVVEGMTTTAIAWQLSRERNIRAPIIGAVHAIIDAGAEPGKEIARLLRRPVRPEHEDEEN
jgi:glycerol-3-phosphate dehydrogenase (NAD(P)+)